MVWLQTLCECLIAVCIRVCRPCSKGVIYYDDHHDGWIGHLGIHLDAAPLFYPGVLDDSVLKEPIVVCHQ